VSSAARDDAAQPARELYRIAAMMRSYRLRAGTEAILQQDVENVLITHGVKHFREHVIPSGRLDFFLPQSGIALELKVDGSKMELARQIVRYLEEPIVTGVLVVTTRHTHRGLQPVMLGKPVLVLHLLGSAF
jgi:hypothetical protein